MMEFYESHLKKRFQVARLFYAEDLSKDLSLKEDAEWHKGHPDSGGVYWVKDNNEYCKAFFFKSYPHWGSAKEDVFIKSNDLEWAKYE